MPKTDYHIPTYGLLPVSHIVSCIIYIYTYPNIPLSIPCHSIPYIILYIYIHILNIYIYNSSCIPFSIRSSYPIALHRLWIAWKSSTPKDLVGRSMLWWKSVEIGSILRHWALKTCSLYPLILALWDCEVDVINHYKPLFRTLGLWGWYPVVQEVLNLRNYYQCNQICHLCRAHKSTYMVPTLRQLRAERYTPDEFFTQCLKPGPIWIQVMTYSHCFFLGYGTCKMKPPEFCSS